MKTTATLLAFGLSALWVISCASGDDDDDVNTPFQPPVTGGSGGYDAGEASASGGGDASAGSGGTSTGGMGGTGAMGGAGGTGGTGGSDAGEEAGPPVCATEYKRCDHEFTYPAGSETTVELRGSFKADGWDIGVALTKTGTTWSATVPVPYDFQVTYKYVVDGTTWVIDPNNPSTVPDGQGGQKSVLAPQSCSWWSCASDLAPGDCPEGTRACDFKFVYPYGGESSVTVKGSFDAWGAGVPMTQDGTVWLAVVDDLGWGTSVQYKFVINGTDWVKDPNNPNETSDGLGGFNSLISSVTCEWWSCEGR